MENLEGILTEKDVGGIFVTRGGWTCVITKRICAGGPAEGYLADHDPSCGHWCLTRNHAPDGTTGGNPTQFDIMYEKSADLEPGDDDRWEEIDG